MCGACQFDCRDCGTHGAGSLRCCKSPRSTGLINHLSREEPFGENESTIELAVSKPLEGPSVPDFGASCGTGSYDQRYPRGCVVLLTTRGAASKTKIVNAAAYFEATASGSTYQIPNSATMLVETPPLPAGDYLAHAAVSGQIPPSTDTSDYIDCFINTLDKNDGRYAWGYNGDMTLAPSDAFMNVRADSRLKLYCFEGESGGNAVVYYGDLSVIRYSSISTSS